MKFTDSFQIRKKTSLFIFAIAAFFYVQAAMASDCFDLSTPIDFGNKVTGEIKVTRICRSEIDQLMNLPIYGFNDDGTGINIGGKKYKVCNDGFDSSSGFSYDNAMGSFYNSKCNFLEMVKLGKVKTPQRTYLKKFTLSKLKQIPSGLFIPYSFITEQQVENFKKSKESKKSLGDLLKKGKIKNYQSNELSLSFEFEDGWYVVKEVARADLNDDGIEDIFVTLNTGINNATHRSSGNLILIKQSESDAIHELKEPSPCENLLSHDLYECLKNHY